MILFVGHVEPQRDMIKKHIDTNQYKNLRCCSNTPDVVDSYVYYTITDVIAISKKNKEKSFKCRLIGIIESVNGHFFLSEICKSVSCNNGPKLRVNVCYLKPQLQTSVLPYPVQIFGTIQWQQEAVLFANILQVQTIKKAIWATDIMNKVAQNLIATGKKQMDVNEAITV